MNCADARQLMLEADLAELSPDAGGELGAHLATCRACRGAADEILSLEAGLAGWLAAAAPRGDTGAALASAAATARRRARQRRLAGALTLAAAAVLATLLVLPARTRMPGSSALAPAAPLGGFSVASPGREVMVVQPADPRFVVVWYLPTRRSS